MPMDGSEEGKQQPPPPLPSDEQLIAWHSEALNGPALAAREGIKVKWLYKQWDRLRREGGIARGGRGGSRSTTAAGPALREGDGRPMVGWYDDPLLERLIAAHGEAGRADLVDVRMKKSSG